MIGPLGTFLRLAAALLFLCPAPAFPDSRLPGEVVIQADHVVGVDPVPGMAELSRADDAPELICSGVLLVGAPSSYPFPVDGTGAWPDEADWPGLVLEVAPVLRAGHALAAPHEAEALIRMSESVSDQPEVAELLSVRPNPSRAAVVFRFAIRRESDAAVSLDVFDVTGRRVARVFDARVAAGRHEASWEGTGPGGARVAAGIYLVRIDAGAFLQTRKFVLLD